MLSVEDANVVSRDAGLPGLATLLDNELACRAFQQHLSHLAPRTACCNYLRYKPGVSCLAGFALDTSIGNQSVYATAYRIDATDKFAKASRNAQLVTGHDLVPIFIPELAIVVSPFPCDSQLPALERLASHEGRLELLSRLTPGDANELVSADWTELRYKPERRYVARLDVSGQPRAVLKLHSKKNHTQARRAAKSLGSNLAVNTAGTLGHSDRHRSILTEWLPGKTLLDLLDEPSQAKVAMEAVGHLLAQLHAQPICKLPPRGTDREAQELHRLAKDFIAVSPKLADQMQRVAERCAEKMTRVSTLEVPLHGDFHPQQIVVGNVESDAKAALIDLDSAALGHPAIDLGNFLAHLQREVMRGSLSAGVREQLTKALVSTYVKQHRSLDHFAVQVYLAAGLLRLAHEPFRYRHHHWHDETEAIVQHATKILDNSDKTITTSSNAVRIDRAKPDIKVSDPFQLSNDLALPRATNAIKPNFVIQAVEPIIRLAFQDDSMEVDSVRVLRHKPGRRCLVEYSCKSGNVGRHVVVLGKLHAKRRHEKSYRLQQALWESGFHEDSDDGISVARPIGLVPDCQMWLQEKVSGTECWDSLAEPRGEVVAARIADAAHKLHLTNLITERVHTVDDELQILEEKLPQVARLMSRFKSRIDAVLGACRDLAASIPSATQTGIHRDFYPDQIIVDGQHIFVLDHDLYCMGDPCLDIGNFCGHLTERSLRCHGHPNAYAQSQSALVDRFCTLRENNHSTVIDAYTTLTVVRHIYLSTRIAGRRSSTSTILDYCEQALANHAPWTNRM